MYKLCIGQGETEKERQLPLYKHYLGLWRYTLCASNLSTSAPSSWEHNEARTDGVL